MDTVHPFPDLNFMPESQPSSSVAGITTGATGITGNNFSPSVKSESSVSDSNVNLPPPPPQLPPSSSSSINSDLLSEFNRLQESFRSAFATQNLEGDDGSDSGAIVALPEENTPPGFGHGHGGGGGGDGHGGDNSRVSSNAVSLRRAPLVKFERPKELVRVGLLREDEHKQHREILKRTRMIFESLRIHLLAEDMKTNPQRKLRADTKAAYMMRDRGLWLNQDKHIVGSIPGIEIGDLFYYRSEVCVVGLHGQHQAGIDYLTSHRSSNGEPIATCIVSSGGYEDDEDTGYSLVYTGHGGQDNHHRQIQDQKLQGGNLAMERSMHYGIEIRVVRGFKYENHSNSRVYVYDGLYKIVAWWYDVGKSGFAVLKFKLVRIENQPEMGSAIMRFAKTLRSNPLMVRPAGYINFDMSLRKENVQVFLYNDIDNDQKPLNYEYTPRSLFPLGISSRGEMNRIGCECSVSCTDDCLCARKNGGEIAYNENGTLLRGKPVVFECGSYCKCGPGCKNRVTQKGLRNRLEVFRSKETGWGVRTLDLIKAGEFICEYAGLILTREQAVIMSVTGDKMVSPGQFTEKWRNWGDLSLVYPEYVQPDYPSLPPLDFAMDMSKMRNVAYYIRDSKNPNLMVQFVLYDHSNLMFPRVMLFAMENISPLTELSMDYGLPNEQDRKLAICN